MPDHPTWPDPEEMDTRLPEVPKEWEIQLRTLIEPVVLLALQERDSYEFYELMDLAVHSGFGEKGGPGMLYRILRQMEEEGLVESRRDASEGEPPRRLYYSITGAGEAHLEGQIRHSVGIEPSEPWPEIGPGSSAH